MFHKIAAIETHPDFSMDVLFSGGEQKRYDFAPLISTMDAFRHLHDNPGLFLEATIDTGGHGFVWTDDIDISGEELFNNGIDTSPCCQFAQI